MPNLTLLQDKLGYTFQDLTILERALTHASCSKIGMKKGHNERLEFLGDRVLGMIVADWLYHTFSKENEGKLSKRHAALVNQETLSQIALDWELGHYLCLSEGEEKTGGREKPSILSDTVEAIIAAVFIDGGIKEAETLVKRDFTPYIHTVRLKDAKSHLQEWLQAQGDPLPTYELVEEKGDDHDKRFVMKVVTKSYGEAIAEASSKQQAEKEAAEEILKQVGEIE